jgi:hypothetical protein
MSYEMLFWTQMALCAFSAALFLRILWSDRFRPHVKIADNTSEVYMEWRGETYWRRSPPKDLKQDAADKGYGKPDDCQRVIAPT